MEKVTLLCLQAKYPDGECKVRVPNDTSMRPKTYEIDFLNGVDAIEIKWRNATTDGDHIAKEHARVQAIKKKGYTPIRVMYYYPQRVQALRIQETIKTIYRGLDGYYYFGDEAWVFIKDYTGIDLESILHNLSRNSEEC